MDLSFWSYTRNGQWVKSWITKGVKVEIFIRLLPGSVTRHDLMAFLQPGLEHRWSLFDRTPHGKIAKCSILKITDLDKDTIEFHGVATIEPASAAMAAIKRLNGTRFKGKRMEVRKMTRRSSFRDKRKKQSEPLSEDFFEERRRDRRRNNLRYETMRAGMTHQIRAELQITGT